MSDLSLVLCSFSLVLGSCSADSKFATFLSVFATTLQRYEEFLNYASFFCDYFSKNRKFLCFRNIFNISGHKSASKRLYRRISDHRAAGCNISGREPQLLSILSVSRLPVCSSFSLCYFLYSFMVRYPPFCPRNIQVFIYSTRTGRFSELGKLDEVKVYKL